MIEQVQNSYNICSLINLAKFQPLLPFAHIWLNHTYLNLSAQVSMKGMEGFFINDAQSIKVKSILNNSAEQHCETAFTGHKIWVASWQILMPCATALDFPKPSRTPNKRERGQWKNQGQGAEGDKTHGEMMLISLQETKKPQLSLWPFFLIWTTIFHSSAHEKGSSSSPLSILFGEWARILILSDTMYSSTTLSFL